MFLYNLTLLKSKQGSIFYSLSLILKPRLLIKTSLHWEASRLEQVGSESETRYAGDLFSPPW